MAWNDAPPTEAELKVVPPAPSSDLSNNAAWDALPPHPAEMDKISQFAGMLRSAGEGLGQGVADTSLGAVQGATLGFADEIQGGLQAGANAIQSGTSINPLNPEFLAKYRAYQQQAEAPYKAAEERSPWLYGAGNIIGGVATAPAMGAAGLASAGGRAAVTTALKQGGKMAAAKALGKEVIKDAGTGGIIGGAFGLGSSQGKIETPEGRDQLLHDTGYGVATGGLVGGAVGLASQALPAAGKYVSGKFQSMVDDFDSPISRLVKKAYSLGEEGVNLTDEETRRKMFNKSTEYSEDFMNTLDKADDMYGKAVGASIEDAEAQGVRLNLDPTLNNAASKIEQFAAGSQNIELDNKTKDIIGRLLTQNGEVSPAEAQYIKKQLRLISDKVSAPGSNVPYPVVDSLNTLQNGVNDAMKQQIPGYGEAAKNFANFRQNTVEQILAGAKNPDIKGQLFGNIRDAESKLQDKIIQMVRGTTNEGAGNREAQGAFQVLKDKLLALQQTNPEAFKAMGKSADELVNDIRNASDMDSLITGITKMNPHEGLETTVKKGFAGLGGTGKSTILNIANKAGRYLPGMVEKAAIPVRLTKKALFELPLEGTNQIAQQLSATESPALKNLGDALQKAVTNKDQVGKNAVLFSILQNPNTRKMLNIEDENK